MTLKRRAVWLGLTICVLCVSLVYLWSGYASARREAEAQVREAISLEKAAERIELLRSRPALSGREELPSGALDGMLVAALGEAGLDGDSIRRSTSQAAHAVSGTVFRRKSTQFVLDGMTLEQILKTLHGLLAANPRLTVERCSIVAVGGDADTWRLEPLEVSYLIYAPAEGAEGRN